MLHWEAPTSLASVVDVLHAGSRIGDLREMTYTVGCLSHVFDLKTLDEVLGQSSSLRQTHANVTGSGPVSRIPEKGAGRESNLGSHVLHSGSRMCSVCSGRGNESPRVSQGEGLVASSTT